MRQHCWIVNKQIIYQILQKNVCAYLTNLQTILQHIKRYLPKGSDSWKNIILQFPFCTQAEKVCVDSFLESNDCLMSCSGLYSDIRKSDLKVIDKNGLEKLSQSYKKYLGNDVPSIKVSKGYHSSDNQGKSL